MTASHVPTLTYDRERLHFGHVALDELATKFKTPLYVYNFDLAEERVNQLCAGLVGQPSLICYAVKANTSVSLLRRFASLGLGADVVSAGELLCARKAGIEASKIVFSGVAKTSEEIALAVQEEILTFNVESPGEIAKIEAAAKSQNKRVRLALRINPDVDAKTHPKIATGLHATKFGLETPAAFEIAKSLVGNQSLDLCGVSCHIGSQMLDLAPLIEAAKLVVDFSSKVRSLGHRITQIDLGGGLGVAYHPSDVAKTPSLKYYGEALRQAVKGQPVTLIIEPGRALVAECGLLLTRVIEIKKTGSKTFVMVDAGMNDLVRPAMYEAYHHIIPVWQRPCAEEVLVDIVGPVCETSDIFAGDRMIPRTNEGDLLAITHAGAYGFSMASHYNLRPKPAEIAISKRGAQLIRKREWVEDLF